MTNENYIPEVGDTLTVASDYITIGGHLIVQKGDKVTVSKVDIIEAHWSRLGYWIEKKLLSVNLVGKHGSWPPNAFIELRKEVKDANS